MYALSIVRLYADCVMNRYLRDPAEISKEVGYSGVSIHKVPINRVIQVG